MSYLLVTDKARKEKLVTVRSGCGLRASDEVRPH